MWCLQVILQNRLIGYPQDAEDAEDAEDVEALEIGAAEPKSESETTDELLHSPIVPKNDPTPSPIELLQASVKKKKVGWFSAEKPPVQIVRRKPPPTEVQKVKSLQLELTLEGNLEDFDGREQELTQDVANELGIPLERCIFLGARAGSVIADVKVIDDPSGEGLCLDEVARQCFVSQSLLILFDTQLADNCTDLPIVQICVAVFD